MEKQEVLKMYDEKEFTEWLNKSISLKPNRYNKDKEFTKLTDIIYDMLEPKGYNEPKKRNTLNCVLSNLYTSYLIGVPLRYSKRSNNYSIPERYRYPYWTRTNVFSVIDSLKEKGFVESQPGFFDNEKGEGKESRIWTSETLFEIFENLKNKKIEHLPPKEVIILKDEIKQGRKKVKILMDYVDTEYTIKLREQVNKINKINELSDIKIEIPDFTSTELTNEMFLYYLFISRGISIDEDIKEVIDSIPDEEITNIRMNITLYNEVNIYPIIRLLHNKLGYRGLLSQRVVLPSITDTNCNTLHRVFNRNSWDLGGRYYGSEIQNIPDGLRKFITIDGESTIELDYSGLHIRMLYHEKGIEPPKEDVYNIGEDNKGNRDLYKLPSLIIVNCLKGKDNPIFSIGKSFSEDKKLMKRFGYGILEPEFIKKLISDFEKEHYQIKDCFYSGVGLRLQNKDSKIMSDILEHFIDKRVPIIPIHDSILIPETYRKEGETIMMETYKNNMGFYPIVK